MQAIRWFVLMANGLINFGQGLVPSVHAQIYARPFTITVDCMLYMHVHILSFMTFIAAKMKHYRARTQISRRKSL